MDNFKESFEDVGEWCEKHLEEQRRREIGMTFGAMLRAYGRLAILPDQLARGLTKCGNLTPRLRSF